MAGGAEHVCDNGVIRSSRLRIIEASAVLYWSLLFQPPDQIEVGEDGFKQWDGKNEIWPWVTNNSFHFKHCP